MQWIDLAQDRDRRRALVDTDCQIIQRVCVCVCVCVCEWGEENIGGGWLILILLNAFPLIGWATECRLVIKLRNTQREVTLIMYERNIKAHIVFITSLFFYAVNDWEVGN
jgi:hypothetical protein